MAAKPAALETLTGLASRFGAFVAERHPFALAEALGAFKAATRGREPRGAAAIEALRPALCRAISERLRARPLPAGLPDTTPRTTAERRIEQASAELIDACDSFLRRAAIEASLTADERREILRGMLLTRAIDNRLKTFFTSGEVRYGQASVQGKGFRSLGQEAICAAAIRIRRGAAFRGADGQWTGDVVGPVIRAMGLQKPLDTAVVDSSCHSPLVTVMLNSARE